MNITIVVAGQTEVAKALAAFPGKAHRACAIALNKTGKLIKEAEVAEMKAVFDNPTSYTLNSLKLTPATKDNLQATVGFKEPARYGDNPHYLFPQVEGGPRHLKGFEQGVSLGELTPALGAKLNRYGNVSFGQIRQILSVHGKAETAAGYNSNITDRSRRRNTKERDYVVIDSRQRGNLPQGVYQRFRIGRGISAKTRRTVAQLMAARSQADPILGTSKRANPSDRSKAYERGRLRAVIRARGLRPVLLVGHTGRQVKPLLDFYGVAQRTFKQRFDPLFWDTLNAFLKS